MYGAIKNYNVVLIPNSIFQIYSNLIDPIDHNSHLSCVKIGLLVIRAVLLKVGPKFYKICFMTYLSTTLFERVRDSTYITLKEIQAGHEKGRSMVPKDLLNPQDYLKTNKLNNKQVGLLFNLRCQSLNGISNNFHKLYH